MGGMVQMVAELYLMRCEYNSIEMLYMDGEEEN